MGDNYENDEFEAEQPSAPVGPKPTQGGPKKEKSALSILQGAAQEVDKEERAKVQEIMAGEAAKLEDKAKDLGGKTNTKEESDSEDDDDEDDDFEHGLDELNASLNTQLRVACNKGELDHVRVLLDKKASMKARDRHGWNALHWAAKGGSVQVIEFLLDEISMKTDEGAGKAVRHFLNKKDSIAGWTPLMVSCVQLHTEAVECLVNRGASITIENMLGETAIDCIPPKQSIAAKKIKKLLGVFEVEEKESEEKKADEHGDGNPASESKFNEEGKE